MEPIFFFFSPFYVILANWPTTGRCVRKGSDRHRPGEAAEETDDVAFPSVCFTSAALVARMGGHASATST